MSSNKSRQSLETAIGILILAVLVIIATCVYVKQFDSDMARFGIDTENPQAPRKNLETINLNRFSPAGFKPLSQTQTYTSETLYEKINGKAPLYTEAGFKKLLTQRFVNKNDQTLWAELYLYDMTDVKNAFAVYSQQNGQMQNRSQISTILLPTEPQTESILLKDNSTSNLSAPSNHNSF